MVSQLKPGAAFSVPCDLGFAVGLMTHHLPRTGHLLWIAEPTFAEEPGIQDVGQIRRWRWPVFFPLGAAIRRKLVSPIGVTTVPADLKPFPLMRSGSKGRGWILGKLVDGELEPAGPTSDPSLPIYQVVNDTRLKEMLVSNWRPEDVW